MIGAGYIQTADKKTSFYVTPYNTESSAVKVPDTSIGGFDLDEDNLKYDSKLADVEVVGGLKLGSSLDDVKKVFGETKRYMKEQIMINIHINLKKYIEIMNSNSAKMRKKL